MPEDEKQLKLVLTGPPPEPRRERLPDERRAVTHRFTIKYGDVQYNEVKLGDGRILFERRLVDLDGYATIGVYENGRPCEIFLKVGKPGDVWAVYDSLMVAISIGLQYGVPLEVFIEKFEHMRFEPSGQTRNPHIPIAKSIPDYLARMLRMMFPKREVEDGSSGCGEGSEGPAPEEGGATPVPVREGRASDQGEATTEAGGHVQGEQPAVPVPEGGSPSE